MNLIVTAAAHELLAQIIRAGMIAEEVSATAQDIEFGARVLIQIERTQPTPEGTRTQLSDDADEVPIRLTKLQAQILHALDAKKPIKLHRLWSKLGKEKPGVDISGHFTTTCGKLCKLGLADHIEREGYVLVEGTRIEVENGRAVAYPTRRERT